MDSVKELLLDRINLYILGLAFDDLFLKIKHITAEDVLIAI